MLEHRAEHPARARYDAVAADLEGGPVRTSQMFGMPCLKALGKAFAGYHGESMVFKLRGPHHAAALGLPGAHLFDPSGRGRPMQAWVVVPFGAADAWPELAEAALGFALGADSAPAAVEPRANRPSES